MNELRRQHRVAQSSSSIEKCRLQCTGLGTIGNAIRKTHPAVGNCAGAVRDDLAEYIFRGNAD